MSTVTVSPAAGASHAPAEVQMVSPAEAAEAAAASSSPAPSTTLTSVPSSAIAGMDYMGYERLLQAAWKDLPNLTIEYRDLAYIRRVPVNKTDIETLATVAASWFTSFQSMPMRDYPALQPCSGTVMPGTMTLVLAPPGHGKSTFLKALGGRYHDDPLQHGQVLFNGVPFKEARAKGLDINRMTAYVDQGDVHMPLLTVRETFQFALDNCVANPALLNSPELKKVHEKKVDLVLELLGLKECESTIIGNEMLRGVSGGQKRRVTIGEMLITNARLLLLDEITTGLDSAASFDILNAVRQWTRLMHGSCVSALLQPTPECFALFDRLVLLRQGHVIYDGPVDRVQTYLESIGIPVPDDQDLADFLTDFLTDPKMIYMRGLYRRARKTEISVTRSQNHGHGPDGPALEPHQPEAGADSGDGSGGIKPEQKDAEEAVANASGDVVVPVGRTGSKPGSFHHQQSVPLKARSPSDFHKIASSVVAPKASGLPTDVVPLTTTGLVSAFKASTFSASVQADLQRLQGERAKLSSFSRAAMTPYSQQQFSASSSLPFLQHTVHNFGRQWKNMARNSSLVGPRLFNSVFVSLVLGSLFYQLNPNEYASRLGLCLFACVHIAFVNQVELPYSAEAKLVIFKQADAGFYPVFSYALSVVVVHLALAISETIVFSVILYYMAGFDPDGGRWLFFTYILLMSNLAMSTLFRWITYMVRFQDVAEQLAGPSTALCMIFGGFLITKNNVPDWFIWMYWLSPFTWAFTSLSQNEFYSPRYPDLRYLETFEIPTDNAYKWAGIGYLTGLFLIFYVFSTLALAYKRFPLTIGTSRVLADEEEEEALASKPEEQVKMGEPVKMDMLRRYASSYRAKDGSTALPFEPIDLAWRDIKYTVQVKDDAGKTMDRVLLNGINGYARAGTLTALMGSSGAGKTTLMDVIAGRKTAGKMEGQIMINGYPTAPQVFQRLMGYVEQTDVHLPTQTVREALRFSARLRLPREVPDEQMHAFVEEVLDILELTPIADRLIGDVSLPSLSPGQLKRVTIGVELVANPPLLFLDEPTSGLDSRAALIVMRVVKRIAQTGRAVVCTIHQPSAELFYMFDRLLLLRSGGLEVFFGDLGEFGSNLVEYFESAPVKEDFRFKLPPRTNPASWMLEVIGAGTGAKLKAKGYTKSDLPDYADVYKQSKLREESMAVLQEVSQPKPGTAPLKLESQFASSTAMQYYMVTSRLFQFYWRNTAFTMTRFYLMVFLAIVFGLLYLDVGQNSQSAVVSKLACVFLTLGFPGIVVCSSSLPVLSRQRAVFYREQSSIMYSTSAYTMALTLVELVYTAVAAFLFHIPVYFMVGFLDDGSAFFKYWFVLYLSMLFFAYMGQFLIAALPNKLAATIVQGLLATFIFLFGGVFIQASVMPVGWKWVYYMDFLPKALIAVAVSQFECKDDGSAYCREIAVTQGDAVVNMRVQDYVGMYLDTGFGMYWKYIGWLILTTFIMRLFGALAISFVNHQKR